MKIFTLTKTETEFVESVAALVGEHGYWMRYDTYENYYDPKNRDVSVVIHWSSNCCSTGSIREREFVFSTPEAVVERLLTRRA